MELDSPPPPIKGFQNYLTVRFKEAIPPSPNPSRSASQSNCQEINAWVVHGVFSSVKGKTFLIFFISRTIWQGGEQIILVSKLRGFPCVFLWPHANPDFGESCQKERVGEEPSMVSTIVKHDTIIPQTHYFIKCNVCHCRWTQHFTLSKLCYPRTSDSKEISFCVGS